ncbi:MAG: diphthine--ammonia ligase [Firmicutes bacterium]|nr:diphthine--ammonia ligase [Bacillota bacterium]
MVKFVISYSGGKDSVLALHQLQAAGNEPVALLVMMNREQKRSWFHGIEMPIWVDVSEALNLPLIFCETGDDSYEEVLENGLRQAKAMGAQACAFGDIDIEDHLQWNCRRCEAAGLQPLHPLWHINRRECVETFLRLGYKAMIKCVQNDVTPVDLLGEFLDLPILHRLEDLGLDACGENGEYHTFVLDGPLFQHPVAVEKGEILRLQYATVLDLHSAREESAPEE